MKKKLTVNEQELEIDIKDQSFDHLTFELNGKEYSFEKIPVPNKHFSGVRYNNQNYLLPCHGESVILNGRDIVVATMERGKRKKRGSEEASMQSPMPGKILKVLVKPGTNVKKGESLLVMEAMKMEHTIKANRDGTVSKVLFAAGDLVDGGVQLIELETQA